MIWLTWRLHRGELAVAITVGVCLAAFVALLTWNIAAAMTGVQAACAGHSSSGCQLTSMDFNTTFAGFFTPLGAVLLVLPCLAGLFIGAPAIAREFEHGTMRLAWTQGVTRRRWLITKIAAIIGVTACSAAPIALASSLLIRSQGGTFTSEWSSFDLQGPVFFSYVVFATALGIAAGSLVRRVVPAMAVTLVGYVAARLAVGQLARPNYLPPLESDLSRPGTATGDTWILGQRPVDLYGHSANQQYAQLMANVGAFPGSIGDYLRTHGVILLQSYQPASRFWPFQSIEALLFLSAAACLVGVTAWSIRRL